jgi:hypothetical protein
MRLRQLFALELLPDGAIIRNVVPEGANPEYCGLGELRPALDTRVVAIERAEHVK